MKTSTQQSSKNTGNGIKNWGMFFLIIFTQTFFAQQLNSGYRLGMGVGTHLSGNSHGAMYSINLSLYNGKNHIAVGPVIQKRKEDVCGANLRYARILTGQEFFSADRTDDREMEECQRIQLFSFIQAQYVNRASMSYKAEKIEEAAAKQTDYKTDYSKYQLSTAEVFAGFGVNTKITNKLVWSTCIGFGTYYHINYTDDLYNERTAPVLMLGTALRLNQFRN